MEADCGGSVSVSSFIGDIDEVAKPVKKPSSDFWRKFMHAGILSVPTKQKETPKEDNDDASSTTSSSGDSGLMEDDDWFKQRFGDLPSECNSVCTRDTECGCNGECVCGDVARVKRTFSGSSAFSRRKASLKSKGTRDDESLNTADFSIRSVHSARVKRRSSTRSSTRSSIHSVADSSVYTSTTTPTTSEKPKVVIEGGPTPGLSEAMARLYNFIANNELNQVQIVGMVEEMIATHDSSVATPMKDEDDSVSLTVTMDGQLAPSEVIDSPQKQSIEEEVLPTKEEKEESPTPEKEEEVKEPFGLKHVLASTDSTDDESLGDKNATRASVDYTTDEESLSSQAQKLRLWTQEELRLKYLELKAQREKQQCTQEELRRKYLELKAQRDAAKSVPSQEELRKKYLQIKADEEQERLRIKYEELKKAQPNTTPTVPSVSQHKAQPKTSELSSSSTSGQSPHKSKKGLVFKGITKLFKSFQSPLLKKKSSKKYMAPDVADFLPMGTPLMGGLDFQVRRDALIRQNSCSETFHESFDSMDISRNSMQQREVFSTMAVVNECEV